MILHWPVVSRLLSYTAGQLTVKPEEIDYKWHNYCTRFKVDLTVQYSAKCLRIRRIIVQMVTVKVIPDTLHGVCQQQ